MATISMYDNKCILSEDDQLVFDNLKKIGQRYNKGKPRYDLIPPDALAAVVDVFTFGASKYNDRNWELGMPWMAVVASLKRHLSAWEHGELSDSESGLLHTAHLAWNALALLTYELRNIGTDDRPRFWEAKLLNCDVKLTDQGELNV